jgi:hypothetical protein
MLPGQYLFLSCVPNVARSVSVFIFCTQCCQARVCLCRVYPMLLKTDTGLSTFGTHDINRHWPGSIGYTWYKQTRTWQHWIHTTQTNTGLATLSLFILFTQCCQVNVSFYLVYQCYHARVCFYLVYPMLSGPCLFLSCVPNVARPVSVFILCTTR